MLHRAEWDFTLNKLTPGQEVTGKVEGLRCSGHQHIGGACLELVDKLTGEVVDPETRIMLTRRLSQCSTVSADGSS